MNEKEPCESSEQNPANPPPRSAQTLFPAVYEQLRRVAASRIDHLLPGQTLQATAVVHEAWLRLSAKSDKRWQSRTHFFATAAEVMRYVLVDHIRAKARLKRGGGLMRLDIQDLDLATADPDDKVLMINEALEALEREQPEKARVVVLKFFGGLTDVEVAETLGVTERTIERYWAYARSWLLQHIENQSGGRCRV